MYCIEEKGRKHMQNMTKKQFQISLPEVYASSYFLSEKKRLLFSTMPYFKNPEIFQRYFSEQINSCFRADASKFCMLKSKLIILQATH